ncbi:leucine-rich repeat-containing protein 47-like [Dermatophagoides farinae]|uniref:Leucine-rich repeat-containing protein 47-like n=1 Tax=Dermatophagoides farinae TaxID=6954 RepID=A0A9D4NT29_DERFA|nr:leucine-rich repeat-containing protein 47-like [Dermatophagoides farinae]
MATSKKSNNQQQQNPNERVEWGLLLKQKPREIVLSGDRIAKQIEEENGLNELLFKIKSLNFLEITDASSLTSINTNISNLNNLTNLVLEGNKLSSIPAEIGQLTKLKCLNLSRNEIEILPDKVFENLVHLQSLNLEQNQLKVLPEMSKLSSLISFKCGSNQLKCFPSTLCDKIRKNKELSAQSSIPIYENGAIHLAELDASHNQIEELPYIIERLVALKSLDLSYNQITMIPAELANCPKLKDAQLKENPIKDRRLYKLIEQCPTKKVLDYLRMNASPAKKSGKNANDDDEQKTNDDSFNDSNEKPKPEYTIRIQQNSVDKFSVLVSKLIINQRKIVACIIHQMDLSNPKVLKKILTIQTKLHQTVCDNRQKATIATHDLAKLLPPPPTYASQTSQSEKNQLPEPPTSRAIYFDGRVPTKIRLVPLGRANEMTAMELYRLLNDEADQYRKEKKRNTISGIHKYIHLLKGKQLYPVLMDYRDNVLSLPPLTNAEYSKIGANTKSMFIEVTGESIPTCRMVMNELIHSLIMATIMDDDGETSVPVFINNEMIIEPVVCELTDIAK